MLTFLRKIRKSLIESGSTRKYLLYSIGEIALVVIGILIALQINNWNERTKSVSAKNVYCQQLIDALEVDFVNLQVFYNRLLYVEEGGMYLWEFVNNERSEIDTNLIKNHFLSSANSFDFTPMSTVYDNLVESGSLSLIESDTLKNLFALYYLPQKGNEEVTLQRINYAADYNDLRFEFASPMMLKTYLKGIFSNPDIDKSLRVGREFDDQLLIKEVDLSAYSMDWKKLKENADFKTYLGRMLAIREPLFDKTRNTKLQIAKMKELLEKEIKK